MAIQLRENIYSVGATDYDVRVFHGYLTPRGTKYNAYLVIDDKITLIDFCKAAFTEEHIRNIEEIVPLDKIDCIIANHAEPDHSGSLPAVLAKVRPDVEVYCTAACKKTLTQYYGDIIPAHLVKAGDTLCTGKYNFTFIPAPFVHWPDSMLTYLPEEKILFSNDALGQHVAVPEIYDDEIGKENLLEYAADYYANIVLPFGTQVTGLLKAASTLDIEMVCPTPGMILRSYIGDMIAKYQQWAANESDENKVVIVYDTMWGSTQEMAEKIAAEWREKGKDVSVFDLRSDHVSTVMAALIEARYIFVGSSTLNNGMLPQVAAMLTYMKGLCPKNRVGMAFGSYGWGGQSIGQIEEVLKAMPGWEVLPSVKRQYKS